MPYVNVGKENYGDIDLHYEDHGPGIRSRAGLVSFAIIFLP